MTRFATSEKTEVGSLIRQIDTAIQELERFIAVRQEIARERGGAGVGRVSRRPQSEK